MITQELVKELFEYRDGELFWKIKPAQRTKVGDKAGYTGNKWYSRVSIKGVRFLNHRIIFLYHHGYLPKIVDHIDRNTFNNRIENLRESTQSQNCMNTKSRKASSSKYLGVSWFKRDKNWAAYVQINGKKKFLGYFTSDTEAAAVYDKAAREHYGEFANLNFKCPVYSIPTKAS